MIGREKSASHELYEKRPYLSHVYATKSQRATGQSQCMQLYRAIVAHSRDKIARENCRCDIGLTKRFMLELSGKELVFFSDVTT